MISILCVDDDALHLTLEKRCLEEPGALTVTTAVSSLEALRVMETNRFDAVVADYQMPGMDGIELLKTVRVTNPGLPFILFTGKGREEVVIEAFNDGVDFYLQKNGDPKVLFARLKDMIKKAVNLGAVWKAFHDSETHYRRLFETAQDGILILDAESGKITDANPFLLTLLGYTREQMLGEKFWEIGFIRDKALAEQAVADIQRNGHIRYEDLPLDTKDGRVIDVELVSNVYVVNNENVIQCNIHDITAHKLTEETLRQSEQRYRGLFENMQEGFTYCRMIYDEEKHPADYIHLHVNPAFDRITGTTTIVGKPATEVFPGIREAFPQLFEIYGRVAWTGEPESFDLNFRPSEKWLHISVYSPSKEHFVAFFEDITERKAAEEAIRILGDDFERKVAERTSDFTDINLKLMTEIEIRLEGEKQLTKTVGEKEVLLREVHHRVKNNLQIIISLLNLQSRYMTDEITLTAFRESQNRVRAMALVHEKLYQSTDLATIDLNNYIRFLGDNLFQFFGMKGKSITLTMDIHDISLAIDTAIPVGLMINELISNSLKYAFPDGRKGEISLAIHRQDHTLTVLFKDNGVGIPENFNWRNAKSLGLRLVILLVEQLDGTIDLDQSEGTAFTIVVKEKE